MVQKAAVTLVLGRLKFSAKEGPLFTTLPKNQILFTHRLLVINCNALVIEPTFGSPTCITSITWSPLLVT